MVIICIRTCFSIILVAIISNDRSSKTASYFINYYPDELETPSISDIIRDGAPPEYIPILILSFIICIVVIGKFSRGIWSDKEDRSMDFMLCSYMPV